MIADNIQQCWFCRHHQDQLCLDPHTAVNWRGAPRLYTCGEHPLAWSFSGALLRYAARKVREHRNKR